GIERNLVRPLLRPEARHSHIRRRRKADQERLLARAAEQIAHAWTERQAIAGTVAQPAGRLDGYDGRTRPREAGADHRELDRRLERQRGLDRFGPHPLAETHLQSAAP